MIHHKDGFTISPFDIQHVPVSFMYGILILSSGLTKLQYGTFSGQIDTTPTLGEASLTKRKNVVKIPKGGCTFLWERLIFIAYSIPADILTYLTCEPMPRQTSTPRHVGGDQERMLAFSQYWGFV